MTYIPQDAHYCHIEIPNDMVSLMPRVIGKEGSAFKAITAKSRVNYIWFHINKDIITKVTNIIEIWGPYANLTKAKKMIMNRIEKIKADNNKTDVDHIL